MCLLAPENPYPIYALPPLVRNAIIETQKNTQAPLAMVATSALTAISIAGSDSNLLIVFYVQIMPDDLVMQLHRF